MRWPAVAFRVPTFEDFPLAKTKTVYTCTECGGTVPRWAGQCPHCQQWNTLVETVAESSGAAKRFQPLAASAMVRKLSEIDAADVPRFSSGIDEFDRVLGGGLVAGGVVLIGGDPGIGKSTLLLQALANLAGHRRVLYVSGEESGAQIALRAQRLGVESRRSGCWPRSSWKRSRPRWRLKSLTSR